MITIHIKHTAVELNEDKLCYRIHSEGTQWEWAEDYAPYLVHETGTLKFKEACSINHETVKNGVGLGIRSTYRDFIIGGERIPYAFETYVWIEGATQDVYFEWIPLCEEGIRVKAVYWPGEMAFEEKKDGWYTLINLRQGLLIPNSWETELGEIIFDGFFGTAGGYMPWFSQVKEGKGYLAVCTTPWDAGYQASHPAGGPYTHVSVRFEPSLGKMNYRRVMRYTFLNGCDYNDICKAYRSYVREQGRLRTLKEKAAQVPAVAKLVGRTFLHTGIKTYVREDSEFYALQKPGQNNHLATFAERAEEIRSYHRAGAKKLYLHLDGWAQPGYDNEHPDYFPACKEAGGWEKMKLLADTLHEYGDLFGIHDQYRDYYMTAASFDADYACRLADGTIPTHRKWAGGPQSFLCGTQALYYLKRNYTGLKNQGIFPDCAYLDVFTCNEGDECHNPRHRMSRKECYEERNHCFDYLMSQGILPSSEEVNDWCIPSMVFSHYAPYDFMLHKPGSPRYGIPVPLFNLVYHDCLVVPWMMDRTMEAEDYMLYALINGGAPYLIRDGAYPEFDGSFETAVKPHLEEDIRRCRTVSELHEHVAMCEMLRHEMPDPDGNVQRTLFSDGTEVEVNLKKQTWKIEYGKEESRYE